MPGRDEPIVAQFRYGPRMGIWPDGGFDAHLRHRVSVAQKAKDAAYACPSKSLHPDADGFGSLRPVRVDTGQPYSTDDP